MIHRTTSLAFLLCAAAALSLPGMAQADPTPALLPAQQFKLHCAVAFAQVAAAQARGDARAMAYPPLAQRGREYFVRASAGATNGTGLTQDRLKALLEAEATTMSRDGTLYDSMPLCMKSLEASGL